MMEDLIVSNEQKIIFLILDGLGDIPNPLYSYRTPLEAAQKPNMDNLALEAGILGRMMPVGVGITPGSGPGHLSLFGYDPVKSEIGRGVLEVLGLDMDLKDGDLAARANFCIVKEGIVTDRRAGRIPTEECRRICAILQDAIPEVDGVKVILKPGESHRFAVIFRGKDLSDAITDADPHKDNKAFAHSRPKIETASFAAKVVNSFIEKAMEAIKGEKTANGVLLRGFSMKPVIPGFPSKYKMSALAIASYPMYRGIAKVLGMETKAVPEDYGDAVRILKENYDAYQFFFLHIKETDVAGEDGNFPEKVKAIEAVDRIIPDIYSLNPQVLVITGDHSTPCPMKGHSWHPVPLLLVTKTGERDGMVFHEKNCARGSIGTIYSAQLMSLALAHAMKFDKYGA
ncbi:MAG: 2,3-bisphosphoglycerate-independent phosphoglycerate mutase [Syntrophobacterales bacterium]|jgi:2,3-bisphosphoglycerate-independent phosphoglycerate mutase|nr:2,3-bisphosphoglycerate-independent phosphoglycerate mutase [Syntrophobacterales bacterium]